MLSGFCELQRDEQFSAVMYAFQLRSGFPQEHVAALAARRTYNDEELIKIGRRSKEAGFYTKNDFLVVCESATNIQLSGSNSADRIKRHTATMIATASELNRIHSLMHLSG